MYDSNKIIKISTIWEEDMSKLKKWLGKTVVATAVGVVSLQASAGAAPLDDLNAILEKQN